MARKIEMQLERTSLNTRVGNYSNRRSFEKGKQNDVSSPSNQQTDDMNQVSGSVTRMLKESVTANNRTLNVQNPYAKP